MEGSKRRRQEEGREECRAEQSRGREKMRKDEESSADKRRGEVDLKILLRAL